MTVQSPLLTYGLSAPLFDTQIGLRPGGPAIQAFVNTGAIGSGIDLTRIRWVDGDCRHILDRDAIVG